MHLHLDAHAKIRHLGHAVQRSMATRHTGWQLLEQHIVGLQVPVDHVLGVDVRLHKRGSTVPMSTD